MFFDWIQIALGIYYFLRRAIARTALLLPGKAAARCAAAAKAVESAERS